MTTLLERRIAGDCQSQPQSTRTPRILCVDDDPGIQTTIELRMRKYDVEIEHAFFGMQGITEAVQTLPDLILMDYAMPVIVLTGMRDKTLKNRLLHAGAEIFLQKPMRFDELVHEMSRFIDLRENTNEDGSH